MHYVLTLYMCLKRFKVIALISIMKGGVECSQKAKQEISFILGDIGWEWSAAGWSQLHSSGSRTVVSAERELLQSFKG